MIRLLRRLGRFPAGTETDYFDAAAEAAFLLDGTAACAENAHVAEPAPRKLRESGASALLSAVSADIEPEKTDYRKLRKDDLLRMAVARGLDVSPRARVEEIVKALEDADADA